MSLMDRLGEATRQNRPTHPETTTVNIQEYLSRNRLSLLDKDSAHALNTYLQTRNINIDQYDATALVKELLTRLLEESSLKQLYLEFLAGEGHVVVGDKLIDRYVDFLTAQGSTQVLALEKIANIIMRDSEDLYARLSAELEAFLYADQRLNLEKAKEQQYLAAQEREEKGTTPQIPTSNTAPDPSWRNESGKPINKTMLTRLTGPKLGTSEEVRDIPSPTTSKGGLLSRIRKATGTLQ